MSGILTSEPSIARFVEAARSYCEWAEGNVKNSIEELQRVRLLLTELHHAALKLPVVNLEEEAAISHKVASDEWRDLCEKFSDLPVKGYWDVFDPLKDKGDEPVYNSLADDFADIYRDIKDNLNLFDDGHVADAVWELRFSFRTHWGRHLTGAQRALHSYFQYEEF